MGKFDGYSRAKDLEAKGIGYKVIYEIVVGSQAYGTATPKSDVDVKGVFIVDSQSRTVGDYPPQIELDADTVYYEYGRFLHLLKSANPTVLEMLFTPKDTVLMVHAHMHHVLSIRDKFVTQKCQHSFGGYGFAQVTKAKGLDKKMNYAKVFTEEKTILDFCYVLANTNKYAPQLFTDWIKHEDSETMEEQYFGLVALNHTRHIYAMYYDWVSHYKGFGIRPHQVVESLNFKGVANEFTVLTSSVPKYLSPSAVLSFNSDAWQEYKKKHGEYLDWIKNRNTQRYVDTKKHGQKIDGKNLLHAVRLVNVAIDIGNGKGMIVRRPEAEYLLDIRHGKMDLESVLKAVTARIDALGEIFAKNKNLAYGVEDSLIRELILKVYK